MENNMGMLCYFCIKVALAKSEMLKKLKAHSHLLYKTGMFLSFLCLIHCLATPILLTTLPFIAKDWISHTTEVYLVAGSLIIAIYLLTKDHRVHNNIYPLFLLLISIFFNGIGLFILPEKFETPTIILGSLIMASAYLLNWKLHSKICSNHSH